MSRLPQIAIPSRKPYPSDLSDAEWEVLQPLLPKPKGFGHPRTVDLREILNGIFYVQRTGCQWEMLLDAVASSRETRPTRCIATS